MKDITKKYTNGEVTVVWKPALCIHSALCFNGLGEVFNPRKHPWVNPEGSSTEKIIDQIKKCPSGALTYYRHASTQETVKAEAETIIEPTANGPLLVYGNVTLRDAAGNLTPKNKVTAFCRCGGSSNKPFCDGTHKKINFQG